MNIKEDLTCKYCREIYTNPITLICCGDNICKQHIEELISISKNSCNRFMCPLCDEENSNQNLNVNKFIQKMVENELHKFKIDAKYKEAVENFNKEIQSLETLLKDPESFIYEEINELKRQVDLDREILKSQIDKLADDLIQKLDFYMDKFKNEHKDIDFSRYESLVESSKNELLEYRKCLDLFSVESEKRDQHSKESKLIIKQLEQKTQ